jgi:hypothetical protein
MKYPLRALDTTPLQHQQADDKTLHAILLERRSSARTFGKKLGKHPGATFDLSQG